MSLDWIGRSHNTDKASTRAIEGEHRPAHDLLRHYEAAFASLGRPCSVLLDLGVGISPNEFASARMWADFLPDARVVSVDHRQPSKDAPPGIELRIGDLGDITFLISLARDVRPDVVVEDASHLWSHQLLSLFYLLPAVAPGGLYIWEDLHVSGEEHAAKYGRGLESSPVDFLCHLLHEVIEKRKDRRPHSSPFLGTKPALVEVMTGALAPMIDRITVVGEAAIIHRRS